MPRRGLNAMVYVSLLPELDSQVHKLLVGYLEACTERCHVGTNHTLLGSS
jgi:hypothetical protein